MSSTCRTCKNLCIFHSENISGFMSNKRPDKFMCGNPGSKSLRYGTGFATAIDLGDVKGHSLVIVTAAHVVYDSSEAEHTTVEFFFDDDSDRSTIIKAKAVRILTFEFSQDFCRFVCHCEDEREERKLIKKIQTLNFPIIPRYMLSNIAICVLHPHGVSKRVSIGQVVKFVEEKEDEGAAGRQLKLLVGKCVCERGMKEKHVLYWHIKKFALQHRSMVDKVLSHLVDKGMIERPSEKEEQIIKLQNDVLGDITQREAIQILFNRYDINYIKNMTEGEIKVKIDEELIELDEKKLSVQMLPGGFAERCRLLFKERDDKTEKLQTGFFLGQGGIAKCLHYSVPTCPGSSGARVNAFKLENGSIKWFITPHSKGGKYYNSSGVGEFYTN